MTASSTSIDDLYHEAYALVEQGICFDEVGHNEGALAMYERGLELIDKAGHMPGATSNSQYKKMARAREHILTRLRDLKATGAKSAVTSSSDNVEPYDTINDTLEAFGDTKSVDELLFISGGVQLFFIRGEDTSVPTYPSSLKIFKFKPDSADTSASAEPPAFLQVGDWVYPLVTGRSPVLHSSWGAYVFPNPTVDNPDLFVGLLLPNDLDSATREQFENYLKEYTILRGESVEALTDQEKKKLSTKIAKLLVSTGELIAWGIEKGTEKTTKFAAERGSKYRESTVRGEKIVNVDPRLQTSVHYLRKGSKVAVKVSGFLVDAVGKAATALGKQAATQVEKTLGHKSSAAGGIFHDTVEVVGGGIAGVATVWMGLEGAAKSLGKSIANETVLVVDHKYGDQAALATNNALYATGHGTMAAFNIKDLGVKGIAKRTAKKAGIGLLQDLGKAKTPKDTDAGTADSSSK